MSWPPWLGSGLALHPVAEMGGFVAVKENNKSEPVPDGE